MVVVIIGRSAITIGMHQMMLLLVVLLLVVVASRVGSIGDGRHR